MDWIEVVLEFWKMYKGNPIFWIILIPFMLWWLNFFKKQLDEMGIRKLISRVFYFAENKLLNRRMEQRLAVPPSPRSGAPVNFWRDIAIWPIMMSPFVIFIAYSTTIPHFSLQWWIIVGWTIVIIIGVFGTPLYLSEITLWLKTNKAIKKAVQKLKQMNISDNNQSENYFNIFKEIADDLRMGLDPRVLPIVYQSYKIDALSFLNELMSLQLVKPDKKTEHNMLACRYYLTRSGATLAKKIKQQEANK